MANDTSKASEQKTQTVAQATTPEPISVPRLIGFSMGSTAGFAMQQAGGLKFPIFNMLLGVSPLLLSLGQAISALVDAFTDPIMGDISDNARTPWGRRRPFILLGAVLVSLVLMGYYMCGLGWSVMAYFWWFTGFLVALRVAGTIIGVPYGALAIEIAYDYDSRTRIISYRSFIGAIIGLAVPWFFRFTEMFKNPENGLAVANFFRMPESWHGTMSSIFSSQLYGARVLMVAISALIIVGAVLTFISTKGKERIDAMPNRMTRKKKPSIWLAMKEVFQIPMFRKMLIAATIIWWSTGFFDILALYVNIYYVCGGDKTFGATITGVAGTLLTILTLIFIPLVGWACTRWEKHQVAYVGLSIYVFGLFCRWFFMTPDYPWIQIVLSIFNLGNLAFGNAIASMLSDVVDDDELRHGGRREGLFTAVWAWVAKMGAVLSLIVAGIVIEFTGFEVQSMTAMLASRAAGTLDAAGLATLDAIFFKMRFLFSVMPGVVCAIALYVMRGYNLTRARCKEIQLALEERRAEG